MKTGGFQSAEAFLQLYRSTCLTEGLPLDETPSKVPKDAATQSVMFSMYKHHTTIKFLVITTFDSYVSYISPGMCGGSTDNGAHAVLKVHELL